MGTFRASRHQFCTERPHFFLRSENLLSERGLNFLKEKNPETFCGCLPRLCSNTSVVDDAP